MRNYFRVLSVNTLFVAVVAMVSCTSVNNEVGSGLVPEDQTMKLRIETIRGGMDTYTIKSDADSIPSNVLGYIMFGKRYNPQFGLTVVSTFSYFVPGSFEKDDYFGYEPVIDSVTITLPLFDLSMSTQDSEFGPDIEQEFGVYQANKLLSPDSIYYSSIDPATFTDAEPIFTFKHKGSIISTINKRLAVTPGIGDAFLEKLLNTDGETLDSDTLFTQAFKGLYIAPIDLSKEDAIIYYCNTYTEEYDGNSAITSINLHYRSYETDKPITPENVKDSLVQSFVLIDAPTWSQLAFGVVKHDYEGSDVEMNIVKSVNDSIEGVDNSNPKLFIQNMAGVESYVRFSKELCTQINSYKEFEGETYSKIIVNSAVLSFEIKTGGNVAALNSAPARLGMYYEYKGYSPVSTPDYDYISESQGLAIPFGGYLNRATTQYEMDITTHIQRLIAVYGNEENVDEDVDIDSEIKREVLIAPSYGIPTYYNYSQVELVGSTSPIPDVDATAPKLKLIFTLVK